VALWDVVKESAFGIVEAFLSSLAGLGRPRVSSFPGRR
jgi:hypothetical protein